MAAFEELELGISHIKNAFNRVDEGFSQIYGELNEERAENVRLKELLKTMFEHIESDDCCDAHCVFFEFCEERTEECWFKRQMRKLGIEVDG